MCHALTCMLQGHTAIAILMGKVAVDQCKRESREAACELLRSKTAELVVAAYLRNQRGDSSVGYGSSRRGDERAGPSRAGGEIGPVMRKPRESARLHANAASASTTPADG